MLMIDDDDDIVVKRGNDVRFAITVVAVAATAATPIVVGPLQRC